MRFLLFLALLLVVLPVGLQAAEPVLVAAGVDQRLPVESMDILEDPEGALTIGEVVSPGVTGRFVPSPVAVPSFGFTKSAYWVRVTLQSQLKEEASFLLELGLSRMEDVRIYRPTRDGGYECKHGGTLSPFVEREFPYRNTVFRIVLAPGEQQTLYLRVASITSAVQVPLTLWSPSALEKQKMLENMVIGVYAGIVLAMFFYNLFIYFSLRESAYFYYVVGLAALLPTVADLEGLSGQYFWPETPVLARYAYPFFQPLFLAALTRFCQLFLDSAKTHPRLNVVFNITIVLNIGIAVFGAPFPLIELVQIRNALIFFNVPLLLAAGLFCWRSGYRPARFYTLASFALLSGLLLIMFERAGIISRSPLTMHGWQIGSVLEMMLLSLALADKINFLKQQHQNAQQKILEIQKDANVQLETKVSQRTRAIEQSPVSIVITDANGLIEYVNPKFTQLSGYTFEEVRGKKSSVFHSDNNSDGASGDVWSKIASGREWNGIFQNQKKSGELYWESASISPIVDAQGVTTHFVEVKEDITQRKQLEEALQEAKIAAEKANEAKSDFLASMSHELRTPLNSILGFAQLLKGDAGATEKIREGLRIIESSGNHLHKLINEILDLSKIEAGEMEPHLASVDLAQLLGKVVDIIRQRMLSKGLQLKLDFGKDLPKTVTTDPTRLSQVLINLLGNAVKFTDEGAITLEVKRMNGKIRFAVQDTGGGIPDDKLDSVFLRFRQLHDTHKFEGTGLGLYISQHLVQMMGGRIEVSSEEGKGSRFWFDLQLPEDTVRMAEDASVECEVIGYKGERKRILIVDDVRGNRLLLSEFLQPLGFETREAESGAMALALTQGWLPDLILMDFRMPGLDGLQAAISIRQLDLSHSPKIVMCSASLPQEIVSESAIGSCDGFLVKPLDFAGVLQAVQEQLGVEWEYSSSTSFQSSVSGKYLPPLDVLMELKDILQRGSIVLLQERLDTLLADDPRYSDVLHKMMSLASDFQLEQLEQLLKNYMEHAERPE